MRRTATIARALLCVCAGAQQKGSITPEMLSRIEKSYAGTASDKAIRNALNLSLIHI